MDVNSVKKEIVITMKVLNRYVYPRREDVMRLIQRQPDLWAEYGLENHQCLRMIWNSINDADIIRRMGEEINERGGFQAMQANYYTLLEIFRNLYRDELDDPNVLLAWDMMRTVINTVWNGVGEWRM